MGTSYVKIARLLQHQYIAKALPGQDGYGEGKNEPIELAILHSR